MTSTARSIVAGVIVRPAWRVGEVAVEGVDEDGFTLAVEAIETLGAGRRVAAPIGRIHLVGGFPPATASMLPEAVGPSAGEVRSYGASPTDFWAAVEAAQASPPGSADDLVVVLDLSGPRGKDGRLEWETAVAAVRVAEGRGAVLVAHRGPESAEARGGERVVVPRPGDPASPSATGPAGSAQTVIPVVRALAECTRMPPATPVAWMTDRASGSEETVTLMREAPVAWAEAPTRPTIPLTPEQLAGRTEAAPPSVSEGAYVPRPTYLETRASRWRLVAEECSACGRVSFPARRACRSCGRPDQLKAVELDRSGLSVEATTVVHPGAQPTEFDGIVGALGAYEVVIVRASPSVRLTLQLTDAPAGSIRIGDRVDTRLRRLYPLEGEWRYGRKAVPRPVPPASPE